MTKILTTMLFFGLLWFSGCKNTHTQNAQLDVRANVITLSDDGKVLVAGSSEMLTIVDVSDPDQMVMRGQISPTFDSVHTIKISPDSKKVYAGYGHDGAFEVDITNADAPKTSRILFGESHASGKRESISLNGANDMVFSRDRTKLFVVNWGEGLVVYDANNSTKLMNYKISGNVDPERIILSHDENKVYIAAGFEGLIIVDIEDLKNPKLAARYKTKSFLHDIAISEDEKTAYLGCNEQGIYVLDIQNIDNPNVIGVYKTDFAYRLQLLDHHMRLYVADGLSGIRVFDTADRTKLKSQKSFASTQGVVYDIAIDHNGKYLYAAGGNDLKLYEIPDS